MEHSELSPVGRLIESGRRARVPKLSQRAAAKAAGISEGRWRQLTLGYQTVKGQRIEDDGPADTIARMALVAGVRPSALRSAGRGDAADVLADIENGDEHEPPTDALDRLLDIRAQLDGVIRLMSDQVPARKRP